MEGGGEEEVGEEEVEVEVEIEVESVEIVREGEAYKSLLYE